MRKQIFNFNINFLSHLPQNDRESGGRGDVRVQDKLRSVLYQTDQQIIRQYTRRTALKQCQYYHLHISHILPIR